ncbi:hypothetical protein [Moraxella lacunata]|uniref:hypothetical protein n=1 Tax=Moraxella lacunata TaxID=477 RepID=UPI003EE0C38D
MGYHWLGTCHSQVIFLDNFRQIKSHFTQSLLIKQVDFVKPTVFIVSIFVTNGLTKNGFTK